MNTHRPNPELTLQALKPFQRATVEHVFRSLWDDPSSTNRFLVADEVGLGKTMVAKGVAARAIDHLWDDRETITIVYICSNGQIAHQNLQRLRSLTGGDAQSNADRLTLLPTVVGKESTEKVRLVSFTPGTSFDLGNSTGQARERALLYTMLTHSAVLRGRRIDTKEWSEYLRVHAQLSTLQREIGRYAGLEFDATVIADFARRVHEDGLLSEFERGVAEWDAAEEPGETSKKRRDDIIGRLRMMMAECAVDQFTPDLVIMDEFQRFKDLFPTGDEEEILTPEQKLAQRVVEAERSKVLILSATPYKMYTLPDDVEGEDHYQDFTRTISFLAGPERAKDIAHQFTTMRRAILTGNPEDVELAKLAKAEAEKQLRSVMSRTERLAATPERDGMLVEKQLGQSQLEISDVRAWQAYDALARHVGGGDTFEYWRSVPYAPNLMDRSSYQVQNKLVDALSSPTAALTSLVKKHEESLLKWEDIRTYQKINPANAKLRALLEDLAQHEADRLVWLPPSLEYVEPRGIFAAPSTRGFTKRLIFSAWGAVPKAVSALTSYEVERQARGQDGTRSYDAPRSANHISFNWDKDREAPRNLPHLTLLHPSITLAELGDPLEIARRYKLELPLSQEKLMGTVTKEIQERLNAAGVETTGTVGDTSNAHWYGIAPYVLDRHLLGERDEFQHRLRGWTSSVGEDTGTGQGFGRLQKTIEYAFDAPPVGVAPPDLAEVLAEMAVGAPGVCALRALTRTGGSVREHRIRGAAFAIAMGFRSLYNQPEIAAIIRYMDVDTPYWRQVIRYGIDGNLQSVLDEYAHMLVESEGLQDTDQVERAETLGETISATVASRAVTHSFLDISATGSPGDFNETKDHHRIRSHFAASFGRNQSQEKDAAREATVRESFNSPFWPFILVSTSVGQEGLDFHTYSHAVIHWNLPSNPVDLEQREGRVHRYKGHAVRKNIAAEFGRHIALIGEGDPWEWMFDIAEADRPEGDDLIAPYWVFTREGGAKIERYVPTMPLSKEKVQRDRLVRTLGAYRLVMGQPRQDELISFIGEDAEWLQIDLSPPRD